MNLPENLSGQRFGSLVAISLAPKRGGYTAWNTICDCGREFITLATTLKQGRANRCWECRKINIGNKSRKHGGFGTKEYSAWCKMMFRCDNSSCPEWKNYGGRGIRVCDEWRSFPTFREDVGLAPSPKHSLDRINNEGNYEPGNIRWAVQKVQQNNRRNNIFVEFKGLRLTVSQWADKIGIGQGSMRRRLARWPLEKCLTKPKYKIGEGYKKP